LEIGEEGRAGIVTEGRQGGHALGREGEGLARRFLEKKGYRVVTTGYRLFRGEIDIIAYDRDVLVFVEVKTRRDTDLGRPEEAVTPAKQRQIRRIAQGYLMEKDLVESEIPCRFDVLAVMPAPDGTFAVTHYENAF
jgi:putative endonuclease